MPRALKITRTVIALMAALPMVAIIAWFVVTPSKPSPLVRREIPLANHGSLIIGGEQRGRSEHGFSQRTGYRPPGATEIERLGHLSDRSEQQFYQAGSLVVVIDLPAAQLYVRTGDKSWKSLALIFPNDLGPFPISYYAERNGLTTDEVSRINQLGGKRDRKYPTTYIRSFDPE